MGYQLSPREVNNLFYMRKPEEIESFINSLHGKRPDGWDWRPLGNLENNAGNVRVSTEPGPPIVERIINGQEALLELAYYKAGKPKPGPSSPRKAVEEWFEILGGNLYTIKDKKSFLKSLASNVHVDVYDSGIKKKPSIAIRDKGIGRHPEDLPVTILSLGGRYKVDKPYLPGVFGQGGSSAYAWCKYSIIVSRQRLEHTNEKPDLIGWTIVREHPFYKTFIYQYLVTKDRKIPTFPPSYLQDTEFDFGTYIIHIAYDLGRLSGPWSRVGYRYLNNLLFDPVLPYTIDDHRYHDDPKKYKVREMTMYGSRGLLLDAAARHSNDIYYNKYTADLGSEGALKVHYWVFKKQYSEDHEESLEQGIHEKDRRRDGKPPKITSYLESERSNRTVIITLNGQRHGYLEKSFVKEAAGSSLLADRLLMQVDCDDLSLELKRELITSTRTGLRTGEHFELIENHVRKALEDDELRRIKRELLDREIAGAGGEDKETRKILDELIRVGIKLEKGPGTEKTQGKGQHKKGSNKYRPKDPPTYFRFAEERGVLEVELGMQRFIDIRTNGPNDMLTRSRHPARLILEVIPKDGSIFMRAGKLQEGRLSITIAAKETAKAGTSYTLRAELEIGGGVYIPPTERPCKIVAFPPPYIGKEPPTELQIATKGDAIKLKQGHTTQVLVRTDCQDELLSRPHQPARFEVDCSIKTVKMEGFRGPKRGEIEVQLQVPQGIPVGKTGNLKVALILADGTRIEDQKLCTVIEAPSTKHGEGGKQVPESNYHFIEVWRQLPLGAPDNTKTWDNMEGWSEAIVGNYAYDKQDGEESLIFYINMDFADLAKEREKFLKRLGGPAIKRFRTNYKAYIAYHLWQLFERFHQTQRSFPEVSNEEDIEQQTQIDEQEEMRRVAKTVLSIIRPRRELLEVLQGSE